MFEFIPLYNYVVEIIQISVSDRKLRNRVIVNKCYCNLRNYMQKAILKEFWKTQQILIIEIPNDLVILIELKL